jgi:hypothetical protein
MQLPNKTILTNWRHESTIFRLMNEYRWPRQVAEQWFCDFMKWLYTSVRYELEHDKELIMDDLHYLDDVWHAYILSTKDYFYMSKTLFDIDYYHHNPENPYTSETIPNEILAAQMNALVEDWGIEYVDRVWVYGADVYDIKAKSAADIAV